MARDPSSPGSIPVQKVQLACAVEDGEGIVLSEGVFVTVVVACDGQGLGWQGLQQGADEPVGVFAGPMEEIAQ